MIVLESINILIDFARVSNTCVQLHGVELIVHKERSPYPDRRKKLIKCLKIPNSIPRFEIT